MNTTHPATQTAIPGPVIFTDLDGTLLDLDTYSYLPALGALARVISGGVPLVFCSSKTAAEQQHYQTQLGFRGIMIVENGGAVLIPAGYFGRRRAPSRTIAGYEVIELGEDAAKIRSKLAAARRETGVRFRGFSEIGLEELGRLTGLDPAAASRAQARDFSETIVGEMSAAETRSLLDALQSKGLSCIAGSRFHTVGSSKSDKGRAVRLVIELFQSELGDVKSIGIGDSANDEAMLSAVDRPFLLQRPDRTWANISIERLNRVEGSGPAAWNRLVFHLLGETPRW